MPLEQLSKVAASRRHRNVAGSFAENSNVALVLTVVGTLPKLSAKARSKSSATPRPLRSRHASPKHQATRAN